MIVFPTLPVRNPSVSIVYHRQLFAPTDCQRVLDSIDGSAWEEAMVGGHGPQGTFSQVPAVRSNRQQRLPVDATGFPLNLICAEICQANSAGWRFDLAGVVVDDLPWVMRYDDCGRGHNDWHVDIGQGANASRKLGFTLQLSPPDAYEGGDLEFHNMSIDRVALRQLGTLIVFPAYWLHRVAPVTRGTRHACVGWAHGPSFR